MNCVKRAKERVDGLGPDDKKKIRSAIRKVWAWSHPRRLVLKRAARPDQFWFCEGCRKTVPKITIDHINPVGEVDGPWYITSMWCSSAHLMALCVPCHKAKTKAERAA